jgi:hypothetical protein
MGHSSRREFLKSSVTAAAFTAGIEGGLASSLLASPTISSQNVAMLLGESSGFSESGFPCFQFA